MARQIRDGQHYDVTALMFVSYRGQTLPVKELYELRSIPNAAALMARKPSRRLHDM